MRRRGLPSLSSGFYPPVAFCNVSSWIEWVTWLWSWRWRRCRTFQLNVSLFFFFPILRWERNHRWLDRSTEPHFFLQQVSYISARDWSLAAPVTSHWPHGGARVALPPVSQRPFIYIDAGNKMLLFDHFYLAFHFCWVFLFLFFFFSFLFFFDIFCCCCFCVNLNIAGVLFLFEEEEEDDDFFVFC